MLLEYKKSRFFFLDVFTNFPSGSDDFADFAEVWWGLTLVGSLFG